VCVCVCVCVCVSLCVSMCGSHYLGYISEVGEPWVGEPCQKVSN
jgi:hypothetical protein